MSKRRWVPIALLLSAFVVVASSLGGCYALAVSYGHLRSSSLPPAISLLGDRMPERALFIVGFAVLAVLHSLALVFRAGQLDVARPHSAWNAVGLVLGFLGLAAVVVMAAIPESSSAGAVHFGAAAVGVGLLSAYSIYTAACCLVWALGGGVDGVRVSRGWAVVAFASYAWAATTGLLGPILFGVWMADVSDTPLEWAGVGMVFASFAPLVVLFAAPHRRPDGDASEREPLVQHVK